MQGHNAFNLWDKTKRYFAFSPEEIKSMILAILILGFVVGFNDGRESFELVYWLRNLFNCIVVVALAIIVRESVRRAAALHYGHKVELKLWVIGIGIALIAALMSNGKWLLLMYGGMVASIMPIHRLGRFRYGLSAKDLAGVAFMTNLANIALAFFFKLMSFLPSPLIQKAIIVNIMFACINMLPIPPLDGSAVMWGSKTGYVAALVFTVTASVLLVKAGIIIALLGSLVLAAVAALVFNLKVELA
ncbi:hypothetical protein KY320_02165 [Candidatus Woesearchaeota archaeon]|nr:hypothetical protein [Candidatus Woesearchaeota archaeon]